MEPTTTRAAVLRTGDGPFTVEELTVASPRAGEVRVQMVAAGMCHTDLLSRELPPEFFAGPRVHGHEGAGIVESVGEGVTSVTVGDPVVLSFNSCGDCPACSADRLSYCRNFSASNMSGARPDGSTAFTDADGQSIGSHYFGQSSFAELSVVAERSVVKVDPSLELARLGPLGCGIQTGAGAVMNSLSVEAGTSLVVAGAGALGLSAIMAAKVVEAETVIAIDRHQPRLDLALHYGATHTLGGDPAGFAEQIQDLTGGGADYAFDATGNAGVVRACYESLHTTGTLGMAGVGFGEMTFDFISMISGRTIRGILEGDSVPGEFIPHLARLNADGHFPYHELIATFPLDDINDAESASASGEVIKPVLVFD